MLFRNLAEDRLRIRRKKRNGGAHTGGMRPNAGRLICGPKMGVGCLHAGSASCGEIFSICRVKQMMRRVCGSDGPFRGDRHIGEIRRLVGAL